MVFISIIEIFARYGNVYHVMVLHVITSIKTDWMDVIDITEELNPSHMIIWDDLPMAEERTGIMTWDW